MYVCKFRITYVYEKYYSAECEQTARSFRLSLHQRVIREFCCYEGPNVECLTAYAFYTDMSFFLHICIHARYLADGNFK